MADTHDFSERLRNAAPSCDTFAPQPKPRPRIFDAREDQREADRQKRAVYAEVDARDQKRCQCCGRRGNPEALTTLGKIHRAHIRDASRGGALTAGNLVSLCAWCHSLVHAKQLWIVGTDANAGVTFEIHEAAVVEIFGVKQLPAHVHIVLPGAS